MYNKAYIYNKNLEVIAIPYILGEGEFKENPAKFYPSWNRNEMYYSLVEIEQPILDNGVLREKTREELILLNNRLELLQDGEYVKDGEIVVVEVPKDLLKPKWSRDLNIWVEGMTKAELIEERKNKIVEYEKLEEEKKILEGSKFSTEDEIKAITEKIEVLEGDINNMQEKIKAL
ncbi:hypothetical protein [Fusobacterium varium]|uniref:hypothetical protein n=1 Tax=Fusobacterium varium TaxID=856 RepID=UPI0030D52B0E